MDRHIIDIYLRLKETHFENTFGMSKGRRKWKRIIVNSEMELWKYIVSYSIPRVCYSSYRI